MNYQLSAFHFMFVVFCGVRQQFDGRATIPKIYKYNVTNRFMTIPRRCKSSPPNDYVNILPI